MKIIILDNSGTRAGNIKDVLKSSFKVGHCTDKTFTDVAKVSEPQYYLIHVEDWLNIPDDFQSAIIHHVIFYGGNGCGDERLVNNVYQKYLINGIVSNGNEKNINWRALIDWLKSDNRDRSQLSILCGYENPLEDQMLEFLHELLEGNEVKKVDGKKYDLFDDDAVKEVNIKLSEGKDLKETIISIRDFLLSSI